MLSQSSYLPTLDGWRAVAIGIVIVHHAIDAAGLAEDPRVQWLRHGTFGVMIFFALSGFLITNRLLLERGRTGRISIRDFYLRRVFRIYPAALVFLFSLAVLRGLHLIYLPLKGWIAAAAGFANYSGYVFPDAWTWYVGHFWSLAVEEHFYLLWPTLLVMLGTRRAFWGSLVLAVGILLWRSVGPATGILRNEDFFIRTDVCADGLLFGCALALFSVRPGAGAVLRKLGKPWVLMVVGAVAVVLTLMVSHDDPVWVETPSHAMVGVALAVLVAATAANPGIFISRVLEMKGLRWVGRISYSLYLWQQVFLAVGTFRSEKLWVVQTFPVNVVMAFGMACASYYLVERPVIALGHRIAGRGRVGGREKIFTKECQRGPGRTEELVGAERE